MAQGRDCSLPGGMKDLLEVVQLREQEKVEHRQQLLQLKMMMERDGPVHPARIFAVLRQKIDQDLLFTDQFQLVEAWVRQIALEEWDKFLRDEPLYVTERARKTIVDATVEAIRLLIWAMRERYLEHRDGDRQIDF